MPLDSLTVKDYDNTKLSIDPPEASRFENLIEREDGDADESTCYDAKELYRRYAEHIEKH